MSRKKSKKIEAVPDEILAEGSGPVGDSPDGDAQALADALSGLSQSEPDGRDSDGRDSDGRDSDGRDSDDEFVASMPDETADGGVSEPDTSGEDETLSGALASEPDGEGVEAGTLPTSAATMDDGQLRHLVEALIFAADRPIALQRLRQLTRISDVRRLEQALAELADQYRDRGIALQQVSGGYQFRTNTSFSPWVQQLIAGRPVRLSRAQLETLAIVAYRQPITRPEIDEIRGVDSSATLRLLLDRALIRVLGKREEVGRPILYGTTKEFLDFFSLGDLRELPTLREYSELTAESRQVMSDRLGVPLAPESVASDPDAPDASDPSDASDGDAELSAHDPAMTQLDGEPPMTFDPDVVEPGSEPTE